jgi:hypothetical protein
MYVLQLNLLKKLNSNILPMTLTIYHKYNTFSIYLIKIILENTNNSLLDTWQSDSGLCGRRHTLRCCGFYSRMCTHSLSAGGSRLVVLVLIN